MSALILSVKIAESCVSYLLWIHFCFDVSMDQVFCFFVTVFWMQILLSPMLCIVIAHKVLTWDLDLSALNALLICKSMCEEGEVKGNRDEAGTNSSLDLLQPWLKTMAETACPAMEGAKVLFL